QYRPRLPQCGGRETRAAAWARGSMSTLAVSNAVGSEKAPRVDHVLITEMVEAGARVLDVGCADGELLQLLAERKGVDGRGVEIARDKVNACVAHGLAVV